MAKGRCINSILDIPRFSHRKFKVELCASGCAIVGSDRGHIFFL